MITNAPREVRAISGSRPVIPAAEVSMLEITVEFEDAMNTPRSERVRIFVDDAKGRPVSIGDSTLYAYEVLELRADVLGAEAGETIIVEDAPPGAEVFAHLWTDRPLDASPSALRLPAGRVGRSLQTLVLGEGPDGRLDQSVTFDVDDHEGACLSLQGRYRIEDVRRLHDG